MTGLGPGTPAPHQRQKTPLLSFPVEPFTQNPLLFLSQERRCTSLLLQASQKRDLTQDGGGLPAHPAEVGRALSVLVSCSQRIRFPFPWVLKDRGLQLLSSQREIFTSSETRAQVYMGALFLRSGNHQSCLPFSPSIGATEAVLRGPLNSSVSPWPRSGDLQGRALWAFGTLALGLESQVLQTHVTAQPRLHHLIGIAADFLQFATTTASRALAKQKREVGVCVLRHQLSEALR